jgi:hypothetical protein
LSNRIRYSPGGPHVHPRTLRENIVGISGLVARIGSASEQQALTSKNLAQTVRGFKL